MCGTTIKVYRKEEVCACMLIYDNPFNQPTLGLTAENDFLITPNHAQEVATLFALADNTFK